MLIINEYKVDAVVDAVLQICQSYSVESLDIKRFAADTPPYMSVETNASTADIAS